MESSEIKNKVSEYYSGKLNQWGAVPKGVDWNSGESQEIRFEQLLKVCDFSKPFSVNDLGCGYGALYGFMSDGGYDFEYYGYDLSEVMIEKARSLYGERSNGYFEQSDVLKEADYTVASGLFNVKMDVDSMDWEEYVFGVLDKINQASRKGFSFNALTLYSDKEYMEENLHYSDPCLYFDHCKKNYSKHVALLHDYPLYEFSILVKKDL